MNKQNRKKIISIINSLELIQDSINEILVKEQELNKANKVESITIRHLSKALLNFGDCLQNLDISTKILNEKFYVIDFSDESFQSGYFKSYNLALKFAENELAYKDSDCVFTISEYADEEDYFNNL